LSERPDEERNKERSSEHTSKPEENAAHEVHKIDLAAPSVHVIQEFVDKPLLGAVNLVALKSSP
jgi:hypothetical protein